MIEWWWLIVAYFSVGVLFVISGKKNGDTLRTSCQVLMCWLVLVAMAAFKKR